MVCARERMHNTLIRKTNPLRYQQTNLAHIKRHVVLYSKKLHQGVRGEEEGRRGEEGVATTK